MNKCLEHVENNSVFFANSIATSKGVLASEQWGRVWLKRDGLVYNLGRVGLALDGDWRWTKGPTWSTATFTDVKVIGTMKPVLSISEGLRGMTAREQIEWLRANASKIVRVTQDRFDTRVTLRDGSSIEVENYKIIDSWAAENFGDKFVPF